MHIHMKRVVRMRVDIHDRRMATRISTIRANTLRRMATRISTTRLWLHVLAEHAATTGIRRNDRHIYIYTHTYIYVYIYTQIQMCA